ncbi:MAG TPA: SsrA-binding protein SmpB [Firmicutes bacterium]|jgi:SsrA-binding protein|nr:SsrA-binding protein SmpB [Bacillota bacterium]
MRDIKKVAVNRKARHQFFIEETFEAGLVLQGTEVKSLRLGRCNIQEAYAAIHNGEAYIYNMHISTYEQGNIYNHDPLRPKKVLLSKREINTLIGKTQQEGYTLIPLEVYFNERNWAKVRLALAKGKKLYDKREDIAKRDAKRRAERIIKERNNY